MQKTIIIIGVAALVGCASMPEIVPNSPEAKAEIEAAIRAKLKKPTGELTKADLEKVTNLRLWHTQISDVSPLGELTQLTELSLWDNRVSDVSALKELKQLTNLDLTKNKISDMGALVNVLKGLKQLKSLTLEENKISDVSALKEMKQLTQ